MDTGSRIVTVNEEPVDLTPTEFDILRVLLENPGYAFTRDELIERGLGYSYAGMGRTLDSHIKNFAAQDRTRSQESDVDSNGLRRWLSPDGGREDVMNRLWVRLSFAFGMVVIAVLLIIGISSDQAQNQRLFDVAISELDLSAQEKKPFNYCVKPACLSICGAMQPGALPAVVLYVAVVTGFAAIIAGVLMSRVLTRPLTELQEMARAIGTNDLSVRAEVHGSEKWSSWRER